MKGPDRAAPRAPELGNAEPLGEPIAQGATPPEEHMKQRYQNAGVGKR